MKDKRENENNNKYIDQIYINMIEYEILGLRFSLVNSIILIVLGFLLCSFTVCSCANMDKVLKVDYEYEIKKLLFKIQNL